MDYLVDIVNFNADASCLESERWLSALKGGDSSEFCSWLHCYVSNDCPVVIGITGATLADIAKFNPEAIALMNRHPALFEILIRPFAHDIALTRSNFGFRLNIEYGLAVLRKELRNIPAWYLPPEFMLTNWQLAVLAELGIEGVFLNPGRFETEVRGRLPHQPYRVTGVAAVRLGCIPVHSWLTEAYLRTIQRLTDEFWTNSCRSVPHETAYLWRDGESVFLIPDGVERERYWIGLTKQGSERQSLRQALKNISYLEPHELPQGAYRSYPVHSFAAWMKEFRMLGYLRALENFEGQLDKMTQAEQLIWLQSINSDILSAVEKTSPLIKLKPIARSGADEELTDFRILRTERGYEGEDYLHLLQTYASAATRQYIKDSSAPHVVKLRARLEYFGVGI